MSNMEIWPLEVDGDRPYKGELDNGSMAYRSRRKPHIILDDVNVHECRPHVFAILRSSNSWDKVRASVGF